MLKLLSILFAALILLLPLKHYYHTHHVDINGTYLLHPAAIEPFRLQTTGGQTFTEAKLKNNWTLIFFGFTECSMVCPLTMTTLKRTYALMTAQHYTPLPQVLFITIDPSHDSLKSLKTFVSKFNPHFIGARVSSDQTSQLQRNFHVPVASGQNLSHSSELVLFNPKGQIAAYFTFPQKPAQLAADYAAVVARFNQIEASLKP
jgi:protein SCO1/2